MMPFSYGGGKEITLNADSTSLRTVKGRGPVRYKPLSRSISVNPPVKSLQLEKTQGMSSKAGSARVFSANEKLPYKMSLGETVDVDSEGALSNKCEQPAKHFEMTGDTDSSRVFSTKSKSGDLGMASYIDPASASFHGLNADCDSLPFDQHLSTPSMGYLQAFYPASSFLHDNSGTQKKIELPGSKNSLFPASVLRNRIAHVPQVDEFLPGNIALDIPFAKEGVCPVAENYFTKLSFQYSVPGSTHMASPVPRDQRIGSSLSLPFTHQATPFPNQLNRVSSLAQHPIVQQMPVDSTIQPPSQVLTQQSLSHLQSGSQKSFETSSLSFREPGILESFRGSIQLKEASLGTGSNIIIPPRYTGIQGDQNFNATPLLFPGGGYYRDLVQSKGFQLSGDISVMQIGGLHHGSLCDPDIDITSTGYAGESQFHFRNSDLTWLPVLPAAAGALGATYRPSHVAPDSCSDNLTTPPFVNIASYAARTSIPSNEAGSEPSNGLVLDYVKKTEEQMNNECGKLQFKPTRQVFKDEHEGAKCIQLMLKGDENQGKNSKGSRYAILSDEVDNDEGNVSSPSSEEPSKQQVNNVRSKQIGGIDDVTGLKKSLQTSASVSNKITLKRNGGAQKSNSAQVVVAASSAAKPNLKKVERVTKSSAK
ncbi:hypothetical protein REPUB_Repub03eG0086000 [Reevesia pubescens]